MIGDGAEREVRIDLVAEAEPTAPLVVRVIPDWDPAIPVHAEVGLDGFVPPARLWESRRIQRIASPTVRLR